MILDQLVLPNGQPRQAQYGHRQLDLLQQRQWQGVAGVLMSFIAMCRRTAIDTFAYGFRASSTITLNRVAQLIHN